MRPRTPEQLDRLVKRIRRTLELARRGLPFKWRQGWSQRHKRLAQGYRDYQEEHSKVYWIDGGEDREDRAEEAGSSEGEAICPDVQEAS